MSEPILSTNRYTRGAETLAHGLAMFVASVRWQLLVSLCAGLGGALLLLSSDIGPERSVLWPALMGRGPELVAGRPVDFLLRQLVFFTGLISISSFAAISVGSAVYGQRLSREVRHRGTQLIDHGAELRRQRRLRYAFIGGGGFLAGLCVWAVLHGAGAVLFLPAYALAAAAKTSSVIADLTTLGGGGELIWMSRPLSDGFYRVDEIYRLLSRDHFAGAKFSELFVQALVFGVLFSGAALRVARRRGPNTVGITHRRGPKPLGIARRCGSEANGSGYRLAGVEIPEGKETYHVLCCGSPGSGKSTAIKDVLDQIRASGRRAVVYDLSGEYLELYYRPKVDKLLNPLDARSEVWTPWADAKSYPEYVALAKSLFPRDGGNSEPFWAEAGSELLSSCLLVLGKASGHHKRPAQGRYPEELRTNRDLHSLLTKRPLAELHSVLKETPAARLLDPKAGSMPQNLIATLTSKLGAWAVLPDPKPGQKAFSIKEFLSSDQYEDGWLFLSAGEDQAAFLKPLISLWADLAVTTLLSLPQSQESKWWVILDEVASLQALPSLPGLLERGRKHGVAGLIGLQAMPQLRKAYGRDGAAALCAQPQTWLVLRSVEPETARWLESALGQVEFGNAETTISFGAHASRDGVSLQSRTSTKPIAMASEIMTLPDFTGFVRLPGGSKVYSVKYQHQPREKIAEAFKPLPVRSKAKKRDDDETEPKPTKEESAHEPHRN